ncbi:MAG TPA: QueT transporter family protein, partial [Bacilli bacterium]|nr:QueT transporter family protein [Bacilli bacterium]
MKVIVRNALIASLYVVLTVINPFSFESIQFRISEILILLVFFRKDYFLGL